jgi:hypothetical protein
LRNIADLWVFVKDNKQKSPWLGLFCSLVGLDSLFAGCFEAAGANFELETVNAAGLQVSKLLAF